MSAGTARDLLSKLSSGMTKIIAADANAERLESLQKSLSDSRLETRVFDVNDRAALASLLADCDLCINGVPPLLVFKWRSSKRAWRRSAHMLITVGWAYIR